MARDLRLRRVLGDSSSPMLSLALDGPGLSGVGSVPSGQAAISSLPDVNSLLGFPGTLARFSSSPYIGRVHILTAGFVESPNERRLVFSCQEALRRGADAVAVQLNFGAQAELDLLRILGESLDSAASESLPLLVMAYWRRDDSDRSVEVAASVAAYGADIVKCAYSSDAGKLKEIVAACAPVPVVMGGGPPAQREPEWLESLAVATELGVRGICLGRNVTLCTDPAKRIGDVARAIRGL